jgi:hypothetical protein
MSRRFLSVDQMLQRPEVSILKNRRQKGVNNQHFAENVRASNYLTLLNFEYTPVMITR